MAVIDLKPLNKEMIEKMGVNSHDLWIIKLSEEVFGPFESESLKHYVAENEELFDEALATRLENNDWRPLFSHALFQRRNPQLVKPLASKTSHEGPFWLLDLGQKIGPLSKQEIDKRIELGSIGLTELISIDDGHSWQKLYQIEGFDRRFHSSSELPFAPLESNFQKARLELIEKIEAQAAKVKPAEELAEMAHQMSVKGKILAFRAEDVPLKKESDVTVSPNLKKQISIGVAAMLALVIGVGILLRDAPEDEFKLAEKDEPKTPKVVTAPPPTPAPAVNRYPRQPSSKVKEMPRRLPASVPTQPIYNPPPPPVDNNYHESQYPTHVETHQNDYGHPNENETAYQEPHIEQLERDPANMEHSLVGQPGEPQNLDQVMGNPQPVEEVSDF